MVVAHDRDICSAEDFENLPEDGLWEVANGRAILLPGNEIHHQRISGRLDRSLFAGLEKRGGGEALTNVNVDIPAWSGETFRTRVPDLVVFEVPPSTKRFLAGHPPEIAIEILATRRGNVERTEKIDDYARAGVSEYWLVDPFQRAVEVYRLDHGKYSAPGLATDEIVSTSLPGLRLDLRGLFDL